MFAKKPLNLDSKSPRAARQPKFLQICHHTSNGPMNYESISKVLNHNIPQVGGHMAATADLFFKQQLFESNIEALLFFLGQSNQIGRMK